MADKILVIGGTGTLGEEVLKRYSGLDYDVHVISRGEHKQQIFKKKYPKFKFHICDIRDKQALRPHITSSKLVYHFAALKSIDICEDNPMECFKTNVLGTINIAELCVELGVKRCVFSSTDKAVDPISAYGYTKALSEKILFDFNRKQENCEFIIFRWGNILGSQGSVLPFFIDQIKKGLPAPLTNERMTRFFLSIEEAVTFMLSTLDNKYSLKGNILIPPDMRSFAIVDLIAAIGNLLGVAPSVKLSGIRKCEKIHEAMISVHEKNHYTSESYQLTVREIENIIRKFI